MAITPQELADYAITDGVSDAELQGFITRGRNFVLKYLPADHADFDSAQLAFCAHTLHMAGKTKVVRSDNIGDSSQGYQDIARYPFLQEFRRLTSVREAEILCQSAVAYSFSPLAFTRLGSRLLVTIAFSTTGKPT